MPLARDILIDILRDEGVTHIFGNPGSTEMPLMDALVDAPDLTYVLGLPAPRRPRPACCNRARRRACGEHSAPPSPTKQTTPSEIEQPPLWRAAERRPFARLRQRLGG